MGNNNFAQDFQQISKLLLKFNGTTICHLWNLLWWPQFLQYDSCQTWPSVIGLNPEQLHPTVPVQCLPCTWENIPVSVCTRTSDESSQIKGLNAKTTETATANEAIILPNE